MSNRPEHTPDYPAPDTGQLWLSTLDAARLLGVHERTVMRAIARITPADIAGCSRHCGFPLPVSMAQPS